MTKKDNILKASESLFAESGYEAVTLRQISRLADVPLSLVHYYFASKQSLYEEVLKQYSAEITSDRLARLKALEKGPMGDTRTQLTKCVQEYIEAYTERRNGADGEAWRNYSHMVAEISLSPKWLAQSVEYLGPSETALFQSRQAIFPESDEVELYWGCFFVSGITALAFAETGRIDKLSENKCKSADLETNIKYMIPFLVAGIQELAENPLKPDTLYTVESSDQTSETDTKNIILDAAESVFAQYGYCASSMRKIMHTAKTNLSLAYYHFENKKDIFIATNARRAKQFEDLRLQKFAALQNKDPFDAEYLENVIKAYVEEPFAYTANGGENWRNYIQLLAITAHTPLWNIAASSYNLVVNNLIEALKRRNTNNDNAHIWCCLYVMGALFCSLAQSSRFEKLSGGKCKSALAAESYKRVGPFLMAGCKRILSGDLE